MSESFGERCVRLSSDAYEIGTQRSAACCRLTAACRRPIHDMDTTGAIHVDAADGQQSLDIESDKLVITPLGSGQEVGRSCIVMEFKGKRILLDCGIHPGLSGMDALPFLDLIEADQIDLLLISHFHLEPLRGFALVLAEDDIQRPLLHDSRDESDLSLAAGGLHQSLEHLH